MRVPACACCGCKLLEAVEGKTTVGGLHAEVYASFLLVPQALAQRGHEVKATDWGGVTQAIFVSPEDGVLTGVSDPRKDGAPAGM